jgi:CBS domain containing-hemolysin-like protein
MESPSSLVAILELLSVPLLVLANAFFVAAEFSLVGIRRTRVEELVREGKANARKVRSATQRLDRYIAATQLGITLASLGLGWLGKPAFAWLLRPLLERLPEAWTGPVTNSAALSVAFLAVTFLHVVMGELAPKSVAIARPEQTALAVTGPLLVFEVVFRPFIWALNGAGNLLVRLLRLGPPPPGHGIHSVEEIKLIVEAGHEAGVIREGLNDLLTRAFAFEPKRARDIMVPRERIFAIDLRLAADQVLRKVREEGFTRVPVFDGTLDNVVGFLHAKDLFYIVDHGPAIHLVDLLRPARFTAPDRRIGDLLKDFKKTRNHLALVREESGRIVGLVTLEDIVEEVFGEIRDEYDTEAA